MDLGLWAINWPYLKKAIVLAAIWFFVGYGCCLRQVLKQPPITRAGDHFRNLFKKKK